MRQTVPDLAHRLHLSHYIGRCRVWSLPPLTGGTSPRSPFHRWPCPQVARHSVPIGALTPASGTLRAPTVWETNAKIQAGNKYPACIFASVLLLRLNFDKNLFFFDFLSLFSGVAALLFIFLFLAVWGQFCKFG